MENEIDTKDWEWQTTANKLQSVLLKNNPAPTEF